MKEELRQLVLSGIGGAIAIVMAFAFLEFCKWQNIVVDSFERKAFVVLMGMGGFFLVALFVVLHNLQVLRDEQVVREGALKLIMHEMRTALTSTGWSIEMLLEKYGSTFAEDERTMLRGVLKSVHASVQHSLELMGVHLVKKEELQISLSVIPVGQVKELVVELFDKYNAGAKQKHIEFSLETNLDISKNVEMDLDRFRVVLENLCENALAYTPEGGKVFFYVSSEDNRIHVEIKDTGMGIPELDQPKIFQEFYRGSNARKASTSGSGIGLYTCKKYVEAHHGKIQFVSKPGEGTTFLVDVPLVS